jgi:hypothetical protein
MAKKRVSKSRKKSYLKRNSRRTIRRKDRRKDKKGKNKKTRKKKQRGGAHLPKGKGRVEILDEEESIMTSLGSEPDLQSEPLSTLSRLSSSKRVNVDEELLSDNNIGMINAHGIVVPRFLFVVPSGICLWVPIKVGVGLLIGENGIVDKEYRRYPPGSLIQEQNLDPLFTWGMGETQEERRDSKIYMIEQYIPSLLLTKQNKDSMVNIRKTMLAEVLDMKPENRKKIERLLFSEHDSRIMPISELMEVGEMGCLPNTIKLSELFKKISEAQKIYADSHNPIPTNWVGNFCRSGQALNLDYLKDKCNFIPGLELYDDDFGGDITYEQEGESQLTHQSSLSSRRSTSNFKQIVEELYRLFNDNLEEPNIPANFGDKDHFKKILLGIKNKIDNIEPLSDIEVCLVFLLRKLNLSKK